MAHEETVAGDISQVFARRFADRTADGPILAELGSKRAKQAAVEADDEVRPTGEPTPSELNVSFFERGGETVEMEGPDGRETAALEAVTAVRHGVVGEARREPKPNDMPAKGKAGDLGDHDWKATRPKPKAA